MSARTAVARPASPLLAACEPKAAPLPAGCFHLRKNGIEFRSATPIGEWTEMTMTLESSAGGRQVRCTGVVVACHGTRHSGYQVALLFTDLSRQTQARLNRLALATT